MTAVFSRVTPLGLLFRDSGSGEVVPHLSVTVAHVSAPQRRYATKVNRLGVYYAANLPGLREAEFGAGDDNYWANLPAQADFIVEVTDPSGRFLPCQFAVRAPFRGFAVPACVSALAPIGPPRDGIPIFPSVAHAVQAPMAAIRAELWNAGNGTPAAWALVTASSAGRLLARGMADEMGRVLILLPYPAPADGGGPSGAIGRVPPLTKQSWPVTLAVHYAPRPADEIPDLCATLAQPAAFAWADDILTEPLPEATLKFGRELTVQSRNAVGKLRITRAASPPF